MNVEYILNYIKTQFGGVEDQNSPEFGQMVLMISGFLLEQVENEPFAFTKNPDDRSLRRSFLHCSKISRILNSFADQYSSPIAQKAQNALNTVAENAKTLSKIQHDCEELENSAEMISKQKRELEDANSTLLNAQTMLKKRRTEFDELTSTIDSLKKIQSEITDEKLNLLHQEVDKLEPEVQDRQREYDALRSRHEELSKQLSEIKHKVSNSKDKEKQLNEQIQQKKDEFETLKNKIDTQKKDITDLVSAIKNANDEWNELHELIEANNKISKAIQSKGYTVDDRSNSDSFFRKVETLNRQASDLEAEYNSLLKNILNEANELLKNLAKRQEPNYLGGG